MKEFLKNYGAHLCVVIALYVAISKLEDKFDHIDDKFYKQQHDIDMIRTVMIVKDIMPIEVHKLMRPDWKEDE